MKNLLFLLIYFFTLNFTFAQWPVIYDDNINLLGTKIITTYDNGFLIIGNDNGYFCSYSKIIKTDVNGAVLWAKTISDDIHQFLLLDIEETTDGGFIIIGEKDYI